MTLRIDHQGLRPTRDRALVAGMIVAKAASTMTQCQTDSDSIRPSVHANAVLPAGRSGRIIQAALLVSRTHQERTSARLRDALPGQLQISAEFALRGALDCESRTKQVQICYVRRSPMECSAGARVFRRPAAGQYLILGLALADCGQPHGPAEIAFPGWLEVWTGV